MVVIVVDKETSAFVRQKIRNASNSRGNDRDARRARLEHRDRGVVDAVRVEEDVSRFDLRYLLLLSQKSGESDAVGDAELFRQLARLQLQPVVLSRHDEAGTGHTLP